MRTFALFLVLLATAVLLPAHWAAADEVVMWPGDPWPVNKPLPSSEYTFFNLDRESFSIAWFVLGDLEDGGALFCNVFITNMGVGDKNATVDMTWIDSQGKDHFVRGEFKPDTLKTAGDKFEVIVGDNYIGGTYPDFRLKISEGNLSADLKLTARLAGWRPNSGYVYFSRDKQDYYAICIPMPCGDLTGTITLDGKVHQVKGRCYMDHSPVTMLPHKYADRWQTLRSLGGEYTINYLEFRVPPKYGSQLATWLLVGKGDRVLFATTNVTLSPSDWETDQQTGKKKPQTVGFKASDGGYSIQGTVTVDHQMEYINILSKLSFVERTVASLFAKSHIWRYRSNVGATLTMPDGTQVNIKQDGISEILYVGD